MAINPLQLPRWQAAPALDFTPLARIGEALADRSRRERLQQAAADATAPDGSVDLGRLGARFLAGGDVDAGLTATRLAEAQSARHVENARADRAAADLSEYRRQSLDVQRRAYEAGKVPAGYERSPDGGMRFIPGGPADPANAKPRQFGANDVSKLTDEGAKFSDVTRFGDTFRDDFGGYGFSALGNAANIAGRHLPESVVGKNTADSAAWWQQYDRYKNVIRNELFGAALTSGEARAFEQADINPGMTPQQIRANLAAQQQAVRSHMTRKARALSAAGYPTEVIGQAYGIDPAELGVQPRQPARPAGATAPRGQTGTAPARGGSAVDTEIAEADAAIRRGADPQAVRQRLLERLDAMEQGQ